MVASKIQLPLTSVPLYGRATMELNEVLVENTDGLDDLVSEIDKSAQVLYRRIHVLGNDRCDSKYCGSLRVNRFNIERCLQRAPCKVYPLSFYPYPKLTLESATRQSNC